MLCVESPPPDALRAPTSPTRAGELHMEILESHPRHGSAPQTTFDARLGNRNENGRESKRERQLARRQVLAWSSAPRTCFFHMRFPCLQGGRCCGTFGASMKPTDTSKIRLPRNPQM